MFARASDEAKTKACGSYRADAEASNSIAADVELLDQLDHARFSTDSVAYQKTQCPVLAGLSSMELGGLEPPTSWVRWKPSIRGPLQSNLTETWGMTYMTHLVWAYDGAAGPSGARPGIARFHPLRMGAAYAFRPSEVRRNFHLLVRLQRRRGSRVRVGRLRISPWFSDRGIRVGPSVRGLQRSRHTQLSRHSCAQVRWKRSSRGWS
jgi:hypothetical protein